MSNSHFHTLLKTLSWRVWASLITLSLAWFFTKSFETSLKIGLVDTVAKLIVYYAHERMWLKVRAPKVPEGTRCLQSGS